MSTRDLTRKQFHDALERNGFEKPVLFWVSSKDDASVSYGLLYRDGKINRRASLAYLIKRREEWRRTPKNRYGVSVGA